MGKSGTPGSPQFHHRGFSPLAAHALPDGVVQFSLCEFDGSRLLPAPISQFVGWALYEWVPHLSSWVLPGRVSPFGLCAASAARIIVKWTVLWLLDLLLSTDRDLLWFSISPRQGVCSAADWVSPANLGGAAFGLVLNSLCLLSIKTLLFPASVSSILLSDDTCGDTFSTGRLLIR